MEISPLALSALVAIWLLPCAIQDWRTRHLSNWLTIPFFLAAWPVALVTERLPMTLAVFAEVYVAWAVKAGLGPANGKIAVSLAAFAPQALLMGVALQALAFLAYGSRSGRERRSLQWPGSSSGPHC
ncbi:MAG TPA: prepilin peptidase [Caldilineae bacterium]|nr:prepilin peptidase [Caldilineae bacterium]